MLTDAERKKRHRKNMAEKGLVRFECYLSKATVEKIEAYKKYKSCTNSEAIEGLLL
ncbi:MAG: hypothetical protein [Caudoviricetes sp.]|nr:MAG: hypothetical protein [Caudoviricetes sp.]